MMRFIRSLRKKFGSAMAGGLAFLPWNLLALLLVFVGSRLFPRSPVGWPLMVKVRNSYAVVRVGAGSDATVFREIFFDRCYDLSLPEDARAIIDVGANVGYSTVWFALRYPEARIWAYEPDPANLARLRRNVRGRDRIVVCTEALSGISGTRALHSGGGRGMSSSLYPREGLKPVLVPTIALDEAVARAGGRVDIVKFDIEGAEHEVFHASHDLSMVRVFIGEVHPDLLPVTVAEFEKSFEGHEVSRMPTQGSRYIMLVRK